LFFTQQPTLFIELRDFFIKLRKAQNQILEILKCVSELNSEISEIVLERALLF
jgi:hypothetical protein